MAYLEVEDWHKIYTSNFRDDSKGLWIVESLVCELRMPGQPCQGDELMTMSDEPTSARSLSVDMRQCCCCSCTPPTLEAS